MNCQTFRVALSLELMLRVLLSEPVARAERLRIGTRMPGTKSNYPPSTENVSVQLLRNEQSCGNQHKTKALLRKTRQSEDSNQPPFDYVLRVTFAPLGRRSSKSDMCRVMA